MRPFRQAGAAIGSISTGMTGITRNDLAYGAAVMVKGSNGVGLAGIVDKIRNRFESN